MSTGNPGIPKFAIGKRKKPKNPPRDGFVDKILHKKGYSKSVEDSLEKEFRKKK